MGTNVEAVTAERVLELRPEVLQSQTAGPLRTHLFNGRMNNGIHYLPKKKKKERKTESIIASTLNLRNFGAEIPSSSANLELVAVHWRRKKMEKQV